LILSNNASLEGIIKRKNDKSKMKNKLQKNDRRIKSAKETGYNDGV